MPPDPDQQQAALKQIINHMGVERFRDDVLQNLDNLTEHERYEIMGHLRSCDHCTNELKAMAAQSWLFHSLQPPDHIDASPGFPGRVMKRIELQSGRRSVAARILRQAALLLQIPIYCITILLTLSYALPNETAQQLRESIKLFRIYIF